MRPYESPERKLGTTVAGDQRGRMRKYFDSLVAKSLRVVSIVLGVYAPLALLFGVAVLFAGMSALGLEEDEFISRRRTFGAVAAGLVVSGVVAAYGAYRVWNLASSIRRRNWRRAKGLS